MEYLNKKRREMAAGEWVCVCVAWSERERERESGRETERQRERPTPFVKCVITITSFRGGSPV